MKILYSIQATGNGHLSRAKEIIPTILNRAQVDIAISGTESEINLPFPIKYRFKGISFVFGKNGGIDYYKTFKQNNPIRILNEIRKCNVSDYDLVINDFEPITAWACYFKRTYCISLSHQAAILHPKAPVPKNGNMLGKFVLKNYAPGKDAYGFHFDTYGKNIFNPIIRQEIRNQKNRFKKENKLKNYYVVYLPAYSDENIIHVLSQIKKEKWKVYSKKSTTSYRHKNIIIKPIKEANFFERSMARCKGIICGAGFETPSEALFLRKKLLVIPMKGQIEQAYNAASLEKLGVPILNSFSEKHLNVIKKWIDSEQNISIDYPNSTQFIIDKVLSDYILTTQLYKKVLNSI